MIFIPIYFISFLSLFTNFIIYLPFFHFIQPFLFHLIYSPLFSLIFILLFTLFTLFLIFLIFIHSLRLLLFFISTFSLLILLFFPPNQHILKPIFSLSFRIHIQSFHQYLNLCLFLERLLFFIFHLRIPSRIFSSCLFIYFPPQCFPQEAGQPTFLQILWFQLESG